MSTPNHRRIFIQLACGSAALAALPLRAQAAHVDEDGEAASTLIARYPDYNCGPFPGGAHRVARTCVAASSSSPTSSAAPSSTCVGK